jgi:hypothetical protein
MTLVSRDGWVYLDTADLSDLAGACAGLLELVTQYEERTKQLGGLSPHVTRTVGSIIADQILTVKDELRAIGLNPEQEYPSGCGWRWSAIMDLFAWLHSASNLSKPSHFSPEMVALLQAVVQGLGSPGAPEKSPRITFDLATNTITLDGTPYEALDPEFVRVMKAIADAVPGRISRAEITKKTGVSRPDRLFGAAKEDAPALERLVLRGKGNGGYQLALPANKSDIQS